MWRKSFASVWRDTSASVPASSTPVGPPPTITNVIHARRTRLVRLALGHLERHQHPLPDLQRVLQALQAGGMLGPLVVAEIRMGRTRRHDQRVVIDRAVGQDDALRRDVHAGGLGQHHGHVRLVAEDPSDRRGDVGRAQRGRRHLVEERLEQVVVRPVNDRDPHRGAPELRGPLPCRRNPTR